MAATLLDTFSLIEFTNHYFTNISDDPHALSIPLGQNINPTGKLSAFALAGGGSFYGEDMSYSTNPKAEN